MTHRKRVKTAHHDLSCSVCGRRLMTGEPVTEFREEGEAGSVSLACDLCVPALQRAARRGEDAAPRPRSRARSIPAGLARYLARSRLTHGGLRRE